MQQVEQRYDYDCMTACIASVFEVPYEEAPVLADPETCEPVEQWLRVMTLWMHERGVHPWHVGLWGQEKPYLKWGSKEIEWHFAPSGFWLGGVKSPRYDGLHCVVMFGQRVVWDPHPQREMGHLGFEEGELLLPWLGSP